MTMQRWEPFRELLSLRNAMDRLFEDSFVRPSRLWTELGARDLPLDMYQTDESVVVKAALPGVKPENVDISITGEVLTIRGEYKEDEVSDDRYICRERRPGTFSRSVSLPVPIQNDKAEAAYENGILTLTLPKAETIKPRQIKIRAGSVIEGKKG